MAERIGHYTIVEELGRGGMGVVYKAHEESLNRSVALKVLAENLTSNPDFLERFVREARSAGGLSHPNIIQIYFIGEDQGRHYFAMEYVPGRSLQAMIAEERKIDNPRAAQILLQAANGLAAAHDHGIIHRDIKPANLMIDQRGVVKIADFGIALPLEAQTRLTATGMLVGTPGYLSPEHCLGEEIDLRADIYALGVTYFEMLTGRMPFTGQSPLALLRQILQEEPPDVSQLNPNVDPEARRILLRMIARNREDRYQTCHELAHDLEEYLVVRGVRNPTVGLASGPAPLSASAVASAAPTAVTREGTTDLAPDASPTIPGVPAGPVTPPDIPGTLLEGRVTPPAMPQQPTTQPNPTADTPPQKPRSGALLVAAILVVLVGGAAVASFLLVNRPGDSDKRSDKPTLAEATVLPVAGAEVAASPSISVDPPRELGGSEVANLSSPQGSVQPDTATDLTSSEAGAPGAPPPNEPPVQKASSPSRNASNSSPEGNKRGSSAETQIAARPARSLSGVAVAASGDPALNSAVAEVLASELNAAGLAPVAAADLPETERLMSGGSVAASTLIDGLRRAGIAVLVFARIEPTGQRELSYLGRNETAFGSRVSVVLYDVASGRPFGNRGTSTLEYTERTADREAEKAVSKLGRKAAETIAQR